MRSSLLLLLLASQISLCIPLAPVLDLRSMSHSHDGMSYQFRDVDFRILPGERLALVGDNGAGKSTLLRCLQTEASTFSKMTDVVVVDQDPVDWSYLSASNPTAASPAPSTVYESLFFHSDSTAASTVSSVCCRYTLAAATASDDLSAALDAMEAQSPASWDLLTTADTVAEKLNLAHLLSSPLSALSGGERKRAALAAGLIASPALLILDEPTNHLDLAGIDFLSKAVIAVPSSTAVLIVTHDRAFLDRVATGIVELDNERLFSYSLPPSDVADLDAPPFPNYATFLAKKAARLEIEAKDRRDTKAMLGKELEWMRRQPQGRQTKQQARINSFYDLQDKANKKLSGAGAVEMGAGGGRLGKEILMLKDVSLENESGLRLLDKFSYSFQSRDRVACVGPNGVGKTTFLRLLLGDGDIKPSNGVITRGDTCKIGYFDQKGIQVNDEKVTVIDFIMEIEPNRDEAMRLLKKFNFPSERWLERVVTLSGGQKRRLQLLQVLGAKPNMLLLDEPSNDLDINTLESLEQYIVDFAGVVVVVSHDVYMLSKTVDHLFVFEGKGVVKNYVGTMAEYVAMKDEEVEQKKDKGKAKKVDRGGGGGEGGAAKLRQTNAAREIKKIEEKMEKLRKEVVKIDAEYSLASEKNEGGWSELKEISERSDKKKAQLEVLEEEWMVVSEELEA